MLEGDAAHHLGHVLRGQTGQLYELSDGIAVWLGRIESVSRNRIEFALLEALPATQPAADITLFLAITKFDAFEWALEKATELGVLKIVPLAAARSEKSLVSAAAKRSERWRKILLESSQQSRRLCIPELAETIKPAAAFSDCGERLRIVFSERPDAPALKRVLEGASAARARAFAVAVGPEGGWTDYELIAAREAGYIEASLGPLILRAETAVSAALAVLNFWSSVD